MNSSFPNRWSFSFLKFTKYVTNIIAEPKKKYGQQEQVTVRNHNKPFMWRVLREPQNLDTKRLAYRAKRRF